jgi:hypothetical protein
MLTGVSHGPKPPRIVRSQAPIVGALVTRCHRLDIDRHPAGRERGEELVPGALGEDPVRHGKDQPVERGEMFEGDKLDTAFALRLRLVGGRIGNQSGAAELAQFGDDFRDAVLSRAPFRAIRYLGPIRRVIRKAECRVPPAPRDKRGRSTEDIRMIHAPAPEIE